MVYKNLRKKDTDVPRKQKELRRPRMERVTDVFTMKLESRIVNAQTHS